MDIADMALDLNAKAKKRTIRITDWQLQVIRKKLKSERLTAAEAYEAEMLAAIIVDTTAEPESEVLFGFCL